MIIDAHCHAGLGDGLRAPWDTEASLDRYLPRAEAAGIDHTIVFPVLNDDYAAANARLARLVSRTPRLSGFCALNPQRDRVDVLIPRAVEEQGLLGIKVHGIQGFPCRRTCALAARYSIPVLFDIFRDTMRAETLAAQYPEVTFIIPHLGGFADDWATFHAVIDQLTRYPNLYADTSGVRYFDALVEAAVRAPGKLVFGSDGPQLHPGAELAKVRLMNLPPRTEAAVLGDTIATLIPELALTA